MEEFGHLDDVARAVYDGRRGSFLKTYADAWLRADPENKRLMTPVWRVLIDKYRLERDLEDMTREVERMRNELNLR